MGSGADTLVFMLSSDCRIADDVLYSNCWFVGGVIDVNLNCGPIHSLRAGPS